MNNTIDSTASGVPLQPPWSATAGRVRARMEGAIAAVAGCNLAANNYHEDDELHWEWLAGWTDARMARMKSPKYLR